MDNRLPAGLRGRVIFGKGNKVTIGDRIRRIRKKRRLTQAELAMMSGLSLSAIQGYEQGRYEPKRKSLESIAEVFKIPVDELYDMPTQLGTNLAEVGTGCISREQAIKTVGWYSCHSGDELLFADNALRQLPPIQPKRGKWIKTARWGRVYYCNQCRNYLDFDGVNAGRGSTNYCPNCGADMREVTE